jgi:hypothetical protein
MSADVAPVFSRTLRVRFTQPSDLNDPFEFRPLIDFEGSNVELRDEVDARITATFGTVDGALAMMEKQQATDPNYPKISVPLQVFRKMLADNPAMALKFTQEMRRHKTDILDSMVKPVLWEIQWEKVQKILGQTVGIFSLTEDPRHTLMWSHYATQHRGVVVEVDEQSPWFNQRISPADDFRHLVRVSYVQNPHPLTWKQLNGAAVLYTKNAEWAYEREWRIIRPLKDGVEVDPGKFCFDVPGDAARSIIFGCRTTSALEDEIRAGVGTNPALGHIRFKRAKLGSGNIDITDASPAVAV